MKILIVDDSAFMRTILKNIILKSKYSDAELDEAVDGNDDIIMPGKDGIEVLKEIGSSAKAIAIISSVDQKEIIEEAKSLGARGYLVKPYDATEVIAMIDTLA